MDEIQFEESMQAARLTNKATQIDASPTLQGQTDPGPPRRMNNKERDISGTPKLLLFLLNFYKWSIVCTIALSYLFRCHLPAAVST